MPARPSANRKLWAVSARVRGISGTIYAKLRNELVSLKRLPGELISEAELAVLHGCSRTPVREAVLKLADEGLIEIFPQSGTFAARIPVSALPEAIVIRKALEETAAQLATRSATRSQILGLRALLERQREASRAGDRDGFHQADEAFHAAIADASGYPGLWSVVEQVKVHVDRYRRLTLPREGRMARAVREHSAIAVAIESGDPASASAAMSAHLDALLNDIPGIRRSNPDYFVGSRPTVQPPPKKRQKAGSRGGKATTRETSVDGEKRE
ncbi:MAG: GntR family transcriptional regulator [Hyphomicrobiales bacterium]|nr:GntR family transcriptional regulator [Hyphomicrobiales bacterium]